MKDRLTIERVYATAPDPVVIEALLKLLMASDGKPDDLNPPEGRPRRGGTLPGRSGQA